MTDQTWLPQRWDVGLWDQAVWDGQLGFNAELSSVRVLPRTVNFGYGHVLTAQKGAVTVTFNAAGLYAGISLPVSVGSIVIRPNPADINLTIRHTMLCDQGMIVVNPVAAQVTLTAFLQPGHMEFGISRVVVPMRW